VRHEYISQGTPTEGVGEQAAATLLDSQLQITAIFAGNNALAAGVLRAIRRRKLRIPEDVALVAFDEVPWMSLVEPRLTVIHQPIYEIGRTAAHLLLERLAGSTSPPREYLLPATLHVHQSCANHEIG
jgi:LacI family transcriptional regulator